MPTRRKETWLALIVLAVALVPAAIAGLWVYMGATATVLHPEAAAVPSTAGPEVSARWAVAAEQARHHVVTSLAAQNVPGVSVAVGVGGEIVWAEGFGWSDLEQRVPMTPATRLRIGTASKALTSAGVGVLLENGRLKLDDEIQIHVPEFPAKQWPVTLRHLMGHLAGIRSDGGDEGPLFAQRCDRPADALPIFVERPLLFEPGTQYRYSDYGWIVVSAAVETAAGEPFLTFMRKQVFEPLGMEDTRADSAADPIARRATFYFPRFASDPRYGLHLIRTIDLSCYAGASVFLSTAADLVSFAMAIHGGKLLQPATVQLLQTSQRLRSGEDTGYGLGWDLETLELAGERARAIGHDGETLGGPAASLLTLPDHGIVVAAISNTSYTDTPGLAAAIARAFAGSPGR
jgi:CubicO group peptidase (beta-lactamase class C family)